MLSIYRIKRFLIIYKYLINLFNQTNFDITLKTNKNNHIVRIFHEYQGLK